MFHSWQKHVSLKNRVKPTKGIRSLHNVALRWWTLAPYSMATLNPIDGFVPLLRSNPVALHCSDFLPSALDHTGLAAHPSKTQMRTFLVISKRKITSRHACLLLRLKTDKVRADRAAYKIRVLLHFAICRKITQLLLQWVTEWERRGFRVAERNAFANRLTLAGNRSGPNRYFGWRSAFC